MSIEIEIVEFKPYTANTLQGFLVVRIIELDLIVADLTLHGQAGKRWIGLPGKPQLDRERKAILGTDGRPAYTPVMKFASRKASDTFRDAVLQALDRTRSAKAA